MPVTLWHIFILGKHMPNIAVSLTKTSFDYIESLVASQTKKNRSAVIEALISNAALFNEESQDFIEKHQRKASMSKKDAINALVKLGYNYFYVIKPELNK